jgi:hypothetical protein
VALALSPVSLVAQLASVAILMNVDIVPWVQEETPNRRDVWSALLLMAGCVGTTVAGSHDSRTWSYAELENLAKQKLGPSLVFCAVTFLLTLRLFFIKRNSQVALLTKPAQGRLDTRFSIMLAGLVPSAASALNNVMLKIVLTVLVTGGPPLLLLPLIGAVAITAFVQVWSTTVGLQLFDMLTYVPVQVAEQILVTICFGLFVFDEMPSNPAMFSISTIVTTGGVLISQTRPTMRESGNVLKEQKAPLIQIVDESVDATCMGA